MRPMRGARRGKHHQAGAVHQPDRYRVTIGTFGEGLALRYSARWRRRMRERARNPGSNLRKLQLPAAPILGAATTGSEAVTYLVAALPMLAITLGLWLGVRR